MSNNYPKFAVVGHPNKGKSSIVSAMAYDDSVQIGDTPGTTQVNRGFPLRVDGEIVYELFDTPGFQRARRILSWLKKQEPVSADKRADLIKKFMAENRDNPKFRDEIELLEPIINGAGIIYVVDAYKPYGSEYEIEMEILRWTGQPSMAILNLIGDEDYSDQWKRALSHYFRLVRTFNPIEAKFYDHMELLESIAQLQEEWTKPIKKAVEVLETLQQEKIEHSVDRILEGITKSLSYTYRTKIKGKSATKEEEKSAKEKYQKQIIKYEREYEREIERIWKHRGLDRSESTLLLEDVGLFSKESASIFGLTQRELILTGVSAGALGGLGIDAIFGGGTLFLASLIGGAVGGIGVMVGFDNLYDIKVLGQSFGKRELTIGPMKNLNFPYILLGRSLYHASVMANRSHAERDSINIKTEKSYTGKIMDSETRKILEKLHVKLRNGDKLNDPLIEEYRKSISDSFLELLN